MIFVLGLASPVAARPLVRPRQPLPSPPVLVVVGTVQPVDWSDTAVAYRGNDGLQITVACPGFGRIGSVWGDRIYTDDSSICTAAVHAGVIGVAGGGEVTIEVMAGQPSYPARTRNGIASTRWESFSGSFVVVSGVPAPAPSLGTPLPISWADTAGNLRGQVGSTLTFACPSGGRLGSVWGSGIYTDDSSICTAAVHAGVITLQGGVVDLAVRPGELAYPASTNHTVTTGAWGRWDGSFVILGAPAVVAVPMPANAIAWRDNAIGYRDGSGAPVTVFCPAGGSAGTVWGTGIYTDDSSICTAAVHEGLIDLERGGEVTLERYPGEPSYLGTTHNGVTTHGYGAWSGSFVFVP